jgi:hypothetical protein
MKIRRQPMTFKTSPQIRRWLKSQARKANQTPSDWIHRLLFEKYALEEGNGAKRGLAS